MGNFLQTKMGADGAPISAANMSDCGGGAQLLRDLAVVGSIGDTLVVDEVAEHAPGRLLPKDDTAVSGRVVVILAADRGATQTVAMTALQAD